MSLRKRLFLTMALILLIGFLGMAHWIRGELRTSYSQVIENFLIDSSHFFSSYIEENGMSEKTFAGLDKILAHYKIYQYDIQKQDYTKDAVPLDTYVTDEKGIVVYSTVKEQLGKDFSKWNDVYKTLRGQYGARATPLDKNDPNSSIYYIAAPIKNREKIVGVVTVYKAKNNIMVFSDEILRRIYVGGIFSVISLCLFGGLILLWITFPLQRLKIYALDVSSGKKPKLPGSNIKEIKQLENAFETMRISVEGKKTIEKYTQSLTHELKSPLTAIKGAAEICLEEMSAEQRERFLKNIINESDRSHLILEKLLQIAALESKTSLDQVEKINVFDLIEENINGLVGLWKIKNISIGIEGPNTEINGDRFLLSQAIRNILQNAIEFSSNGSCIQITTKVTENRLNIDFIDEGVGIPVYAKARMFEKFYSLERPDTKKKGTGLGLNFVQEVAHLHQGTVKIISPVKNEKGTCVHIEFLLGSQ